MNTQPSTAQDDASFDSILEQAKAATVHITPATTPASSQPATTPPATSTNTLDPLAGLENIKQRKEWLLDHVADFAILTDVQISKLILTLNEDYSLPSDWLKRDWRPLVRKQPKPNGNQTVSESDLIRKDLKQIIGGDLALNECTQDLHAGDTVIDDGVMAGIRVQMRDKGWKAVKAIEDVILMDAYANSFNPIKYYLEGLIWDGKDHIAELAAHVTDKHPIITYADGTQRTVFHAYLRQWLIGTVSKLYTAHTQNPVLVLDGKQGIGKSEIPLWLSSPFRDFYTEKTLNPDDKELERMLACTFIWEIAEFGATTRKADRESLKSILTRHYSTFRVPYARSLVKRPIMSSFFGTINEEGGGFLSDPTGNRRFLVANVEQIDWSYKANVNVDQVWAQVVALYQAGQHGTLTSEEVESRDAINSRYETGSTIYDLLATLFEYDRAKGNDPDWQMTATDILRKLDGFRVDDKSATTAIGIYMKKRGIPRTDNHPRYYCGVRFDHTGKAAQATKPKAASTQPTPNP